MRDRTPTCVMKTHEHVVIRFLNPLEEFTEFADTCGIKNLDTLPSLKLTGFRP